MITSTTLLMTLIFGQTVFCFTSNAEPGPSRYRKNSHGLSFFLNFSKSSDGSSEGTVDWDQLPEEEHSHHISRFHMKRSVIPKEDCSKIISLLTDVEFETDPDSVDEATSFEFWLVNHNRVLHDHSDRVRQQVMDILQPSISTRIQPMVDAACPGEKLKPCFSFIRRYTQRPEEERMKHLTHFDIQSYATFVVSLNTQGEDFHGGIYVATAVSNPQQRHYLNLSAGDGAFHHSDLLHGVNVVNGTRWSFILWFSGPGGDCNSDPTSWHREQAEAGDPVFQFLHGHRTHDRMTSEEEEARGIGHEPGRGKKSTTKADIDEQMLYWLGRSAKNGFPLAQTQYGDALVGVAKANGGDSEKEKEAVEVLRAAVAHGEGEAMYNLGSYYLWKSEELPDGHDKIDSELKAATLFDEACAAESVDGCIALAEAILNDRAGARPEDPVDEALHILVRVSSPQSLWNAFEISEDRHYLHRAAKMGHSEAQYTYGSLLVEEQGKMDLGLRYLEAAAAKKHFSSKSLLKRLKRASQLEHQVEEEF